MATLLNKESLELASFLMYHLWARRNAFIFQNQFSKPSTVTARAQSELSLFIEYNTVIRSLAEGSASSSLIPTWKPPNRPFVKVNFDAAFDKINGRMGMGIVIGDHAGSLKTCLTASRDNIHSVFQAEGEALHRAMSLCLELGMCHVIFEGDAKVIIDAVNSKKRRQFMVGTVDRGLAAVFGAQSILATDFCSQTCKQSCSYSS
ncbi:uncharacterized protein LOC121249359 [Juglans microcarpa x Juglans regia]|uniref:uncharacterized protein LOC121249359 n=1 Tax=Juglans microcarpa x Juglans regia TaxID=2249226 RepID=UPI001B7F3F58|nr:uncharacterized protein LOC121249359 [Juglans microcarpa x Juglans regia]